MKPKNDIPKANYVIALICAVGILVNVFSGNFDMMTNSSLFLGLLLIIQTETGEDCQTEKKSD